MELPWRVKLRQAEVHLRRFDEECAGFISSARVGFDFDTDIATGTISVHLRADDEPPMLLGAIVGDVLHNLRSALDSIAWETCQRAGVPAERERDVYFPIGTKPSGWKSLAGSQLPRVAPKQLRVFEELQPWFQDEVARSHGIEVGESAAAEHPLARLHDLASRDRHRVPHPILARAGWSWLGMPDGVTADLVHVSPRPWKPGQVILRWQVHPPDRAREAGPSGDPILAFSEEAAANGEAARDELRAMLGSTTEALRRVEVEVLEVVTPTEMAELESLRTTMRETQSAVQALMESPHVIDADYIDRYGTLNAKSDEARRAYSARWRELFD